MNDKTFEGAPVYDAAECERVVFAGGKAAMKYAGGEDGPFFVTIPQEAAMETAYNCLLAPGKTTSGVEIGGIHVGRDQQTQHLVMSISFPGGGKLNLMFNEAQEEQIYDAPRLPPRRSVRPN